MVLVLARLSVDSLPPSASRVVVPLSWWRALALLAVSRRLASGLSFHSAMRPSSSG